jgi:hypothetical protein
LTCQFPLVVWRSRAQVLNDPPLILLELGIRLIDAPQAFVLRDNPALELVDRGLPERDTSDSNLSAIHRSIKDRPAFHRHLPFPQSSSASRFTAGAAGFFVLIQSRECPER